MNERVRRIRDEFEGGLAQVQAVMCECIDPSCAEMLQLAGTDIVAARTDPDGFIVAPSHATHARTIVREHEAFAVVRFG